MEDIGLRPLTEHLKTIKCRLILSAVSLRLSLDNDTAPECVVGVTNNKGIVLHYRHRVLQLDLRQACITRRHLIHRQKPYPGWRLSRAGVESYGRVVLDRPGRIWDQPK